MPSGDFPASSAVSHHIFALCFSRNKVPFLHQLLLSLCHFFKKVGNNSWCYQKLTKEGFSRKVERFTVFSRRTDLSDVGSAGGCGPGTGVLDWILWALFGGAGAAEEGATQDEKRGRAPADVKSGPQLSPLGVG